ncbi:MAG: putative Ig domain-containing protein [Methanomassiliicoccaceae archaeon]|nr:putative Ig domain-containing protein [Methanomassiliicoccaceae archaeon]
MTYSLTGTVPAGVLINLSTGVITTDSSTVTSSYSFTVTASNGAASAAQPLALIVTAVPGDGGSLSTATVVARHRGVVLLPQEVIRSIEDANEKRNGVFARRS